MPADLRGPAEGAEEAVPRLSCRYFGSSGRYTEGQDSEPEPQSQTEEDRPGRVREVQFREGGAGPKRRRWAQAAPLGLRELPGGPRAVASSRPLPGLPELVTRGGHISGSRIWSPRDGLIPGSRSGSPLPVPARRRSPRGVRVRSWGSGHPEEASSRKPVTPRRPRPVVGHPKEAPS